MSLTLSDLTQNVLDKGGLVIMEALLFMLSEALVRFIYSPYVTNGNVNRRGAQSHRYRIYLCATQVAILLVTSLLVSFFSHIPYLLLIITSMITVRLLLLLSQGRAGYRSNNSTVSMPLPKVPTHVDSFPGHSIGGVHQQRSSFSEHGTSSLSRRTNDNISSIHTRSPAHNTGHYHSPRGGGDSLSRSGIRSNPQMHHYSLPALKRPPLPSSIDNTTPSSQTTSASKLGYLSSMLDFRRRPSKTPPGILNSGNTCFVNSTLQCLIWTPSFVDVIPVLRSSYDNRTALINNLNELIYQCHNVPDGETVFESADAFPFLRSISSYAPHLVSLTGSNQSQQDAAEFLLWLLNHLHGILRFLTNGKSGLDVTFTETQMASLEKNKDSLYRKLGNAKSTDLLSLVEPLLNLSDVEWQLHWQKHSSSLYQLFLGQLVEARECQHCMKMSVSVEYFTVLSLPLPSCDPSFSIPSSECTLAHCFQLFGQVEDLDDSNMMSCSCLSSDNELSLTPGKRLAMLSKLPSQLIVQLTRYSYDISLNTAVKNKTHVVIPTEIELSTYTMLAKVSNGTDVSPLVYELRGICMHSGAQCTTFGHYVSYCKAADNVWYYFNDSDVRAVSNIKSELKSSFVLENAYLLFFSKT